MRKKLLALSMISIMSASILFGCSDDSEGGKNSFFQNNNTDVSEDDNSETIKEKFDIEITYSDKEKLSVTANDLGNYDNVITLNNESVTITESGEYVLEGTIEDGQIIVDVSDTDTKVVTLILNGVTVSSSNSAPIYVKNAEKVVLSLVEGTTNTFSDSDTYTYEDEAEEEPNACIFSKDDLVISGNGELVVNGNFNNGIYSKDDLTITSGKIKVNAVNNGIKGKDSIAVLDADIEVVAGGDGMCSSNATDEGKGFIVIEEGSFKIEATEDAIQAETCMEIKGGEFELTTGEGAKTTSWGNKDSWGKPGMNFGNGFENENSTTESEDTVSKKAVKGGVYITISGGEFNINSEDDAIHTNGSMDINDGTFAIKSGDDGMHADNTLIIDKGEINITQCYEGIEATNITVNDGDIHIVSTDDGFNAAGGNDASAGMGRPGMNNFGGSTGTLTYNGGYIYVNASGDGLDSNGTISINGGYIIVDGPANGGNGAFDYSSSCDMTDGFLLAVGYSQMAQMPNDTTVNSVMIGFTSEIKAGELVNISDANGNPIITFSSAKSYNNMVLCTSLFKTNEEYTVSVGGNAEGEIVDGICSGSYEGGTVYETFEVTDTINTVGNATGGMGGMGGMGGQMPGGQMPGGQMPGEGMQKPGGGRR